MPLTQADLIDRRLFEYVREPCFCKVPEFSIVYIICSNGVRQYRLKCCWCDKLASLSGSIPLNKLTTSEKNFAELFRSNVDQKNECVRCGCSDGVKRHYWAPRAIFEDSDDWPTSFLCRECHVRWDQTMCEYYS